MFDLKNINIIYFSVLADGKLGDWVTFEFDEGNVCLIVCSRNAGNCFSPPSFMPRLGLLLLDENDGGWIESGLIDSIGDW